MFAIRVLVVTLAIAALIACRTQAYARQINLLGRQLVSIEVPSGLLVLLKSELEHGEYDIRRVNGVQVMRIVIDDGLRYDVVDFSTTYYCVNGIEGVTVLKKGVRKILLHLPPEAEGYRFYFEFSEKDATANKVMSSLHLDRSDRSCRKNAQENRRTVNRWSN
jgi:hypothetical protein